MPETVAERVLVLAPIGRDGPASADLLERAGVATHVCSEFAELCRELLVGATAVFVAEEALFGKDLSQLTHWVSDQPAWSDLPFVLLTSRHDQPRVTAWRQNIVEVLGNVSLLERPVQPITLSSTIRAAVRARKRQYEVKALLEAREKASNALQQQVAAATDELRGQLAERARIEDSLRQAQKMEAIGQLTGGIAHDFNNLLTAITSSLELLKKRIRDDDRSVALLDNAINGAERGARLTQRMLAFARRQDLTIEPVHLNALVSGMRSLIERAIGPLFHVRVDIPDDLPPVGTDANQLEAALLNLTLNARDSMPQGGDILIAARTASDRDCLLTDADKGHYNLLSVTDSGEGMNAETIARAAEPFFTTKGIGKGTGLGLSMVQGLAEQSGGKLRITSVLGRGTTVEILLPVVAPASREVLINIASESPLVLSPSRRGTVLVVDDDALVLRSTSALLDDMGYSVLEAEDAEHALTHLEDSEHIDFVLTDHAMPGMTGLQLALRVQKLQPDLPIILATGYAELDGKIPSNVLRLAKPFRRADLENAISQAMALDR
jgi:signal transduction histidine kinase/CheY-like chemotaxis protein